MSERTLILLRHAQAETGDGVSDIDRRLSPEGRRQAQGAGRELVARHLIPQRVICSVATRTCQTWDLAAAQFGDAARSGIAVDFSDELYRAYVTELLDEIHAVPDDPSVLLVVGHNPAISAMVHHMADPALSSPDLIDQARFALPTAAFAVLTIRDQWPHAAFSTAHLASFYRG